MTTFGRRCALWVFLTACFTGVEAAAEVQIEGAWSYSINGDQVTLEVDRIVNYSSTVTTGTLYLTLWLTASPDPYTTGHSAARVSLHALDGDGRLRPNYQYENIRLTTPYIEPAPGTYYVHLYVSQWPDLDTTLDLTTATSTLTVEPETVSRVRMLGNLSYSINGDEVTLAVDEIANLGRYRTSGTLYLTMWLTEGVDPYTSGHIVGRASFAGSYGDNGTLPPGQSFRDVSLTTPYSAPPPGTYYVHFYLSEWPELDTALDFATFTDTFAVEAEQFARIDMAGAVSYLISGDEVTLEVERIVNVGNHWTSGTLHLTLWLTATPDPYTTGYIAGRKSLAGGYGDNGTLPPGQSFYNVRLTMPYAAPPPGTYYVHLYASEYPDLDTALDLETFTRTLDLVRDDHGDEPANATSVALRSQTKGEIQWRGDVDVFRVRVNAAGTLRVGTTGTTDTHGSLSDEQGRLVATDDDSGEGLNFQIRQSVGPGVWYIAVRGFSRSTLGGYVLTVAFERNAPDPDGAGSASIAGGHLGDFDGDGRDDVLLRHADGRWYLYPMNGRRAKPNRGTVNLTGDLDYSVAGIGDFNGDRRDDVLLRHRTGTWLYYPMAGRRVLSDARGQAQITADVAYAVAGVGDFNGDGRDDVLLRHRDGRWRYYPMNGRFVAGSGPTQANLTSNTDFKVAGIGDFNGDGRDDVLLRRSDGRWHYYPMNGARPIAGRGAANLTRDLAYSVAGIGDFDGDGRDDVMLRHTDGRWHYYRMNGRRSVSGSGSASLTKNMDYWVAGVGDLNGDGRADLLLRHAEGRWYFYPMNGRRAGSGRGSASLPRDLRWSIPRPPQLSVRRGGTISGTLAIAPGQVLDGDTPDPGNSRQENDTIASAQRIPSPVSVAGHAGADDDTHDVYLLTLPAPTRISLAIADADADLDLHLADTDGTIIAESLGVDDLEAIHTDRTGDHLVMVSAYSGASNYTLVAAVSGASHSVAGASTRPRTTSRDGAFVSGELIVNVPVSGTMAADALPVGATNDLMRMGLAPHTATPSGAVLVRSEGVGSSMGAMPSLPAGFRRADTALHERAATLLQRKRLLASGRFDGVQPNYIYHAMAVPNDPYFQHQWHYPAIGLAQAWDITTGDDDVVVAVIDTGVVTDHPDLAPRILRDARNRPVGYDFISDRDIAADGDGIDSDPYDVGDRELLGTASSFHGTHVAGTIGAATNNAKGVAGVMWRGRILPIRVLGRGGGSSLDIAEGIRYAAGLPNVSGTVPPRRADVINLSLGPRNPDCEPHSPVDTLTRAAIEGAVGTDAIVVVAAGNDSCHWPNPMATIDDVASVGATDQLGRAPYSNFGAELDVVAPGGNKHADVNGDGSADGILSAAADDSDGSAEPIYRFEEGTSMAAPHVAGVFGLMLSVNPRLKPTDITRLLAGTHPDPAAGPITRDWGAPGWDHEFGHGLIDASRAVRVARAIRGGDATDPPDRPILAVSPSSLHFDATATVLRMELSNVGTGTLSTRSVSPDRAWMDVSFDEWPTVVVNVDRSGLAEGTFVGSIQIDSDGGSIRVPVTLRVQRSVTQADVGRIYVLALDPATYETRADTATSAREGYAFALPELPAGQYVVAAGTDRDNDGYICDAGEACGVWPLRDSPSVVELDGDRRVDFGVSIDLFATIVSQSSRTSRVAPDGFRIAPP